MVFVVKLYRFETCIGVVESVVVEIYGSNVEDSVAAIFVACLAQAAQYVERRFVLATLLQCECTVELGLFSLLGLQTLYVGLVEPCESLLEVL